MSGEKTSIRPGEQAGEDTCFVKNGTIYFGNQLTPCIKWQDPGSVGPSDRFLTSGMSSEQNPGPASPSDQSLLEAALETREELLEWDAEICEAVLRRAPVKDILSRGSDYLPGYYTLVNREMLIIYASAAPSENHFPVYKANEKISDEIVNDLILQKEFHDAAKIKTFFYYHEINSDIISLCHNIYINGQYFARLLLMLPEGQEKFSAGEEEIFSHFAARVEQMYQTRTGSFNPLNGQDQVHRLCQASIAGDLVDPSAASYTLNQIQWKSSHTYVVCEVRFFSGSDWNAQLETTLPYLVNALEQEWEYCCAFVLESVVLCVVNLSAFSAIHQSRERPDPSRLLKEFCRKMGVFVREHVCQAGISSLCRSFSHLKEAALQAHTALQIGPRQNPSYWYHRFDDCRLDYMLESLKNHAMSCMQEHPDLIILKEYDANHGSNLYETLEAYIDCQMNMQAAADHLYIHRTTFCRRMDRIRELLGKDLSVTKIRLELELALHLEKI